MIATQCNTKATTSQPEQIRRALIVASALGLVTWDERWGWDYDDPDYHALNLLSPHRHILKKNGAIFPTKSAYIDRLEVIPINAEAWQVENLTKGTAYEVALAGLRLDCSCSKAWGSGWCKHREAVEDWRDAHGATGPFGVPDDEPDVVGGDMGMDGVSAEELNHLFGVDDAPIVENVSTPEQEKRWAEIEFELNQLETLYELEAVTPGQYRTRHDALIHWAENGDGPRPRFNDATTYDFGPYWTAPFPPSDEQTAALQAMAAWWDGGEPIFRLTGSAGCGKSTAAQAFIKWLRGQTLPPKIAVAAAINKAVKVQQRILREWGLGDIPTHTCAQLFGVRRKVIDGEEVFEHDPGSYEYFQDYGVIIVDEGSTINAQLWGMLLDAAHMGLINKARFIIMGDPAQLPPINEGESMAFRHDCPSAHLSTVQRYDGAIAVLADDCRLNLDRPVFPTFTTDTDPETKKGIYAVDRATWEAMIRKVFTGPDYQANPDHVKILAYTNARVDALNVLVRNALGYRAPWVVGERIIALAPYAASGCPPALTTSDEATITDLFEGTTAGVACWFLRLSNGETIPVPRHPSEFEAHLKELKKLKAHGKYWAIKEAFASVTYAYALTVHRSQGSTYNYAFVDVGDFKKCKGQCRTEAGQRILERNQLLYVALTRPSERLIISA